MIVKIMVSAITQHLNYTTVPSHNSAITQQCHHTTVPLHNRQSTVPSHSSAMSATKQHCHASCFVSRVLTGDTEFKFITLATPNNIQIHQ